MNESLRRPSRPTLWMLALLFAGMVSYSQTFRGPFIFDDIGGIVENPALRVGWPTFGLLQSPRDETPYARPLVELSLRLNYAISGLQTWSYHLVNFLLHVACAAAIYCLILSILRFREVRDEIATGVALVATAIWLVHPLQTSAVTYVIQRAEVMMSLCYLLTLLCGLAAIRAGRLGNERQARRWTTGAIAACFAGMFCKESMVTAPLAVLLADVIIAGSGWTEIARRRWKLYAGLGAGWVLLGALMHLFPRSQSVGFQVSGLGSWEYFLIQCQAVVHYLRLLVWPVGQSIDYFWAIPKSVLSVIFQALFLAILFGVGIYESWRRRWWGYCLVMFFLILAPTSSLIPIVTSPVAEHRMYLASVFLIFPAAYAGRMLCNNVRTRIAIGGILVLALAYLTYRRNEIYQSEVSVWADVLKTQPANARAMNNLGRSLEHEGKMDAAIAMFRKAIVTNSQFIDAYYNLGTLLGRRGAFAEAEKNLLHAASLRPNAPTYVNLGMVYFLEGRKDDARKTYETALEYQPSHLQANFNLAVLEADRANWASAREHLQRILKMAPNYPRAGEFLSQIEKATASENGKKNP